jgi:hypothetical protein
MSSYYATLIFHSILMHFFGQNDHLYGLLMGYQKFVTLFKKRV